MLPTVVMPPAMAASEPVQKSSDPGRLLMAHRLGQRRADQVNVGVDAAGDDQQAARAEFAGPGHRAPDLGYAASCIPTSAIS